MRSLIFLALLILPIVACSKEGSRSCTIKQIREVALAQQSGGPQAATSDDAGLQGKIGTRYQVALDCNGQILYGLFTQESGFDSGLFVVGAKVAVVLTKQELQLKTKNAAAIGIVVEKS